MERTEAVRASTEGQESRDSRGDGGGSRKHERAAAGSTRGRQGHTGGAEWTDTTGSRQGREKHETQ